MTDVERSKAAIDATILEAGKHLAELPSDEARKLARRQLDQITLAALPEDAVGRPPVRTLGEYLAETIELPPMLVEPGLVAVGGISVLISRGGKGKTAVSLNKIARWAMGKPLFDELPDALVPVRPLKTLLIENEGSPGHFQSTLRTIAEASAGDDQEALELVSENVLVWGNGGWSGLKVDNEGDLRMIDRACEEWNPDILFVEPFRGLWRGEENSASEMANVLDSFSALADKHELGVMLTHHENKYGTEGGGDPMTAARGSTAFEGHAAVMERWVPVQNGHQRELKWIKARFTQAPGPVRMEWERDRWGYRYVTEDENLREIKACLYNNARTDYITAKEAAEELGETYETTRRRLNEAVELGFAKKKSIEVGDRRAQGYRYAAEGGDSDDDGGLAVT